MFTWQHAFSRLLPALSGQTSNLALTQASNPRASCYGISVLQAPFRLQPSRDALANWSAPDSVVAVLARCYADVEAAARTGAGVATLTPGALESILDTGGQEDCEEFFSVLMQTACRDGCNALSALFGG